MLSWRKPIPAAELGPPGQPDPAATAVRQSEIDTGGIAGDRISKRLLARKELVRRQDHFVALQVWEGIVEEVREDTFLARLVDRHGTTPDHEAEIYTEEVSPGDRKLMAPGAVFYWSIGYLDTSSGQRKKESVIRFRALPRWSTADLARARERVRALASAIE